EKPAATATAAPEGAAFVPSRVVTLADSGLPAPVVSDLVLKAIYNASTISTDVLASSLHVRFSVIAKLVSEFVEQSFITTRTSYVDGKLVTEYTITTKGEERALRVMEHSQYAGPAPVPLALYSKATRAQSQRKRHITRDDLRHAYNDMVLPDGF